jgi:hypothetical protein
VSERFGYICTCGDGSLISYTCASAAVDYQDTRNGNKVPQSVNSPTTCFCGRSECRQCGLRLQHHEGRAKVRNGPSVLIDTSGGNRNFAAFARSQGEARESCRSSSGQTQECYDLYNGGSEPILPRLLHRSLWLLLRRRLKS